MYTTHMNEYDTTIRFSGTLLIAFSLFLWLSRQPSIVRPTTPFLLYEVLSLRDESVRGNGRFSCCNRTAQRIAPGYNLFYSENGDYCANERGVWSSVRVTHLDAFRRLNCNFVFVHHVVNCKRCVIRGVKKKIKNVQHTRINSPDGIWFIAKWLIFSFLYRQY